MSNNIAIDSHWCLRPLGSTCNRCSIACPKQAISFNDASLPQIDSSRCVSCALCAGICDAFVCTELLPLDVLSHALSSSQRAKAVYVTCMHALGYDKTEPASNVLAFTCLAELSPELWLALLAHRIPLVVACDEQICASCPKAGTRGYTLWNYALTKASEITGQTVLFNQEIPYRESLLHELHTQEANNRRELFEGLGNTLQDFASGQRRVRTSTVLDDCIALQEQMHARSYQSQFDARDANTLQLVSAYKPRVLPQRHELLQKAAAALPSCAHKILINVAKLDTTRCDCSDYPCTKKCPTHALRTEFNSDAVSYDPRACIGCGYCSAICPHKAISLTQVTAELFNQN